MTPIQGLRYYLGGIVACGLLGVALFILPGGKHWNPTLSTLIPGGTLAASSLLVAYFAFVGLSREERARRVVEPVVCLCLTAITSMIIVPVLYGARAAATTTTCLSNVRQLSTATAIYLADNNDFFPMAANWSDRIQPYLYDEATYRCPNSSAKSTYAINAYICGVSMTAIEDVQDTVLIFECESNQTSPAGGSEMFLGRH